MRRPRLAKVNVTGQLADDEDVQPRDQFGLEAGGTHQLLVADGGAEIGEQAQVLAQAQNGLLRAQRAVELVVLPVADGAEQYRVRGQCQLEGGFGQGMAMGLVGGTADQGSFHFQGQVKHIQDLDGLGHNFGSDAVTRQYCNFHSILDGHFVG
jgi:hypothetical protein